MQLPIEESKRILTDIAFDDSKDISNEEAKALRCGVQALSMVENIKTILQKRDNAFDAKEFGASYSDLDNIIEEIREVVQG